MNKEELYKIALSNVPKYSLLNEILAIRDNRFPDEENDYSIKVYGSISLDVLNRYVRYIDRLVEYQNIGTIKNLKQLQTNWNELKKGLQSLFEFDYGVVSKDYLECAEDTLEKMQELEQGKDE